MNELKICFRTVSETETLDSLTREAGVPSSSGHSKGELPKYAKRPAKNTLWTLDFTCKTIQLKAEIDNFFSQIKSNRRLESFIKKRDFVLSIVCYMIDRSIELSLSRDQIKYISELNCELEIDYYILPPHDEL